MLRRPPSILYYRTPGGDEVVIHRAVGSPQVVFETRDGASLAILSGPFANSFNNHGYADVMSPQNHVLDQEVPAGWCIIRATPPAAAASYLYIALIFLFTELFLGCFFTIEGIYVQNVLIC